MISLSKGDASDDDEPMGTDPTGDADSVASDSGDAVAEAAISDPDALPTAAREPVTVGAKAGSARAAARASAVKSGVTAGKGRATPSRGAQKSSGSFVQRIARFLREVVAELRKVIWPTRNEMVTYSIVVILFLIFMIAVTWGADFGFARLILLIFG